MYWGTKLLEALSRLRIREKATNSVNQEEQEIDQGYAWHYVLNIISAYSMLDTMQN